MISSQNVYEISTTGDLIIPVGASPGGGIPSMHSTSSMTRVGIKRSSKLMTSSYRDSRMQCSLKEITSRPLSNQSSGLPNFKGAALEGALSLRNRLLQAKEAHSL